MTDLPTIYLVKHGELTLKGGNRKSFEKKLCQNLAAMLKGSGVGIVNRNGRIYLHCPVGTEERAEECLDRLMGIAGWARARTAEKNPEAVIQACVEEGKLLWENGKRSFKVEARRTDKSFPLDSYQIRCMAGDAVKSKIPSLRVDVKNPDAVIYVEIREKAYVYGSQREGRRGLPVGMAGKGMLLLSGGIDSPVAGYMMASRGMFLDAVYFHAWPYTSDEARQKTRSLAEIVGIYTQGICLFTVSFTALQTRIKERAPESYRTVLLRMAMMECAEKLALRRGCKCLINGESLSQVASQTVENISCTQSRITLPVFRPLIGMNKDEIIARAENIGTYKTSILPYEDCCTLFSPPHPVLRGDTTEAAVLYGKLEAESIIEEALNSAEMERLSFPAKY